MRENIPLGLRYACVHAAGHVSQTPPNNRVVEDLVKVFVEEGLMTWLEVLSLIGRAHEAVGIADVLGSWLKRDRDPLPLVRSSSPAHLIDLFKRLIVPSAYPAQTTSGALFHNNLTNVNRLVAGIILQKIASLSPEVELLELLYDLKRFVMKFMEPITASSTHIYHSALPFTPQQTSLFRVYSHLAICGPKVIRGLRGQWPQTLWTANKHLERVSCLLISPDGKTIVSGSDDCTLRLWDASTGSSIGEPLKGHTSYVRCLAISPDGKTVVSGSDDRTVRLWGASMGSSIGEPLEGHTDYVRCLAISSDGKTVVSGSLDQTVRLWDAGMGSSIGEPLKGHTDDVRCLAISPDGKTVVSGSLDQTVRLTGSSIGEPLKGHTDYVRCLAISPDGKTVVSGSDDRTVRLWDASTGSSIGEPLKGHTDDVRCLAISPDGKTVVSGSDDRTVRLWDAGMGSSIGEPLKGHTSYVRCLAISPDGKTVVSGSDDRTVRLWDASTGSSIGEPLKGHMRYVKCLAISPHGKTIVSGSRNRSDHLQKAYKEGYTIHNYLKLTNLGWVVDPMDKRLFWSPDELRGHEDLYTLSNTILVVKDMTLPLLDISFYLSYCKTMDATVCYP
ncbi:POC1 centriolar protein A [Tulasnella sp. JGI-2019a]|nr:POC1 centriolar protein A [Tulasnella sp. JGI-2019a]